MTAILPLLPLIPKQSFFESLYENAPIGIILCTISECIVVQANKSALTSLGFSDKELPGLRLELLTVPDDWSKERLILRKLESEVHSCARLEKRFLTKNGGILWVDVNISIIQSEEGRNDFFIYVFQEIVEKKGEELAIGRLQRTENLERDFLLDNKISPSVQNESDALGKQIQKLMDALMNSERTLKQVQGIAKLGMWKMDLSTQSLEWSDETYRIFGVTGEKEISHSDLQQLTHPEDREVIKQFWESAVRNKSVYDVEYRILSNGKTKWVREQCAFESDAGGKAVLAVGVVKDVTEQKRWKEYLEVKNRELQEIMDALDESSLVSIADRYGVILKVNKRFCEVAKYRPDELIGKNHNIISSGYHDKVFWQDFWKTIQKGEVWRGEIRNRAKDGSEYWVNTTINPIRNEKGDIIHYLSIRQDITSRKIYEQLLLQSNLRLAQIEQFIDFTTDAIHVSDLEGQFVYINQVASQRLGIAREECERHNVTTVDVLFSARCDWTKHVTKLKQAGVINIEGVSKNHSTGVIFPVELTMRYISIHDKDYVIVVSRDITERKKNELVLRESQARLAEAQRMAKLGYWEYDVLTNKVWWSDEQYKINGISKSAAEVTQDDFLALLHPDDRESFLEQLNKVTSGKSDISSTYRIVRPDGKVRLISGYSNAIFNEHGETVKLSGINQDITDRIMTEKALRESEETLRKAQAVAKVGSWKLNLKNGLLEWSDEVYKIFEVPKGKEITEAIFLSYVHPDDKEFVEKAWAAALKGSSYDIVHRIIVNKGVKWVREQAELTFDEFKKLIYGFGTVQDVTDHKILQDSNLIFNQSLLLTGLGSWRASFKSNDLFLSDNVYNLHGANKENTRITFRNFVDYIYPEDRSRILFILAKVLIKKGSFETEYRVEGAPSQIRWLSAKGKVLTDHQGNPIEMYGIVRDITLEKNNTEELIKARKEAEEASYVKDEFLSVMSHEIRTPLNSVIGLSNLILKRNPREDQLEIVKTLKGSADNLLHLVNDILDFNKIRAGKLQLEFIPFSLAKFLQHLHASFKLSAVDKDIDFNIYADSGIPDFLVGDVTRLNQIFNNLLGNAIKFTHKGSVNFKAELKARIDKYCTVIFKVEDTGVGIPSEKLDTIFLPFQQSERDTSRKYGGTGLGLSIVKSLVQILHGTIRVDSSPGRGSVFIVELSFTCAAPATVNKVISSRDKISSAAASSQELKTNLTVLYVEDVESNRFLVENLLSDHMINATTASSGRAALRLTELDKFDLIIMDIQMPGMDGYVTTQKIRTQKHGKNHETPVLAFTAEPFSEELRKKVMIHGIQDVLTKPFDEDTFIDRIRILTTQSEGPSERLFSFSFYENAFNQDKVRLKMIKRAVIKDLERFTTRIEVYEGKGNWKGMSSEIHRIRPIIKNLACTYLMILLERFNPTGDGMPETKMITRSVLTTTRQLVKEISNLDY